MSPDVSRSTTVLALIAILALSATLRLWGKDYGVPQPTIRPDEERTVDRAYHILATGDFHPGDFFYAGWHKYVSTFALWTYVQYGKLTGRYDRTVDFLFDAAVLRPGLHYRLLRSLSILFALATIVATFVLGTTAYRRRTIGIVAALIVATCFLHVRNSRFGTVDTALAFYVVMSTIFAVRISRRYELRDFLLAGAFAGMATATKYNAGLTLVPIIAAALPALLSRGGETDVPRSRLFGRLAIAGAVSALVFAACSPYNVLNPSSTMAAVDAIREALYGGSGERAWWIHARYTFPFTFGWPFYVAAAAGIVRALWRRRGPDLVLLAFIVPSFASMAWVTWVVPRYLIPMVPLAAVLAAELVVLALFHNRVALSVAAGAVIAGPGLYKSVHFDRIAAREDTRLQAASWIGENVPPQSEILVCDGYGAPLINSDRRRPPAFRPREIECALRSLRPDTRWVVTHEHPTLTSFSGVTRRMRDALAERGRARVVFDPFTPGYEGKPFYYTGDAFFIPVSELNALERGGPIVTIWELEPDR
jgi:4-amino-4-deoxy-L-arabinose transferase-like glycosyltransferase